MLRPFCGHVTYPWWCMFWAHSWIAQASQSADRETINHPALSRATFFPFPPTPFLFSFCQALEKLSSYTYCQLQTAGCVLALERVIYSKPDFTSLKPYTSLISSALAMLLPITPYLSSRSLTLISFTDLFFSTFLTGISFPVLQRKEKLYAPASHLLRMFLIIKFKLWLHIISRLCFNNGRAKLQLKPAPRSCW